MFDLHNSLFLGLILPEKTHFLIADPSHIQRCRDHQCGSYQQLRDHCGLSPLPTTFALSTKPKEFTAEIWLRFGKLILYFLKNIPTKNVLGFFKFFNHRSTV